MGAANSPIRASPSLCFVPLSRAPIPPLVCVSKEEPGLHTPLTPLFSELTPHLKGPHHALAVHTGDGVPMALPCPPPSLPISLSPGRFSLLNPPLVQPLLSLPSLCPKLPPSLHSGCEWPLANVRCPHSPRGAQWLQLLCPLTWHP